MTTHVPAVEKACSGAMTAAPEVGIWKNADAFPAPPLATLLLAPAAMYCVDAGRYAAATAEENVCDVAPVESRTRLT